MITPDPDSATVLTLCEPYGSAVIFGGKDVENRKTLYRHRGPTLIHAGKSVGWMIPKHLEPVSRLWDGCPRLQGQARARFAPNLGMLLGIVVIREWVSFEELQKRGPVSRWAFGRFCALLEDPQIVEPQAIRGQLGFFKAPIEDLLPATRLLWEAYQRKWRARQGG